MSKNAVYCPLPGLSLTADVNIKQAAMMFERVHMAEWSHWTNSEDEILYQYLIDNNVVSPIKFEKNNIEWMMLLFKEYAGMGEMDDSSFNELLNRKIPIRVDNEIKFSDVLNNSPVDVDEITDQGTRANTVYLQRKSGAEFYSILRSENTLFGQGKKEQVVRFVLKQMPRLNSETNWEAIIDFRRDETLRLKYLALINWINEISSSQLSLNEIEEKYEYLYYEYKRAFDLHRLQHSLGMVEILAGIGAGLLIGNFTTASSLVSNLLKIGTTTVSLKKEEGQLPGKEIAYIYHTGRLLS